MPWLLILLFSWQLHAAVPTQETKNPVDFEQRIGDSVPPDLELRNEEGTKITLGSLLHQGKPVILSLAYFHCKTLCPLNLNGIIKATNDFDLKTAKPFETLIVSIDPRDTFTEAVERRRMLLSRASSALEAGSLHVLTGPEKSIARLADAVGFRYQFDARSGQYQHPSGLIILTEEGRISRYFFGIEYDPPELQAALNEASEKRQGRLLQKLVMACYRYNAETGTYTLAIYKIMRLFSVALLAGGGLALFVWERRRLQPK